MILAAILFAVGVFCIWMSFQPMGAIKRATRPPQPAWDGYKPVISYFGQQPPDVTAEARKAVR